MDIHYVHDKRRLRIRRVVAAHSTTFNAQYLRIEEEVYAYQSHPHKNASCICRRFPEAEPMVIGDVNMSVDTFLRSNAALF